MKVKIELDRNQTHEEAEESLYKALSSQRDGKSHSEDRFPDPAMEHQAKIMIELYSLFLQKMNAEIIAELEKV